jgi:hypothetical protein
MATLVSKKLKRHLADQFIESITEPANNVYYMVASKHTDYANNASNTHVPLDTNKETEIDVYEEGIFGKKVSDSDVYNLIPKYMWTSNTVYTPYEHDVDLEGKTFYAAVDGGSTYYVYKCLDNNGGVAANDQPSSTNESACNFITSSDGYTWKLMYTLPEATFEKFATDDFMPVKTSANVSGNTVGGAIDVVKITDNGSGYLTSFTGTFQVDDLRTSIPGISGNTTTYRLANTASSNTDFYKNSALYISSGTGSGQLKRITSYTSSSRVIVVNSAFTTAPDSTSTYTIGPDITIDGDGTGFEAYATIASNSTVNNYISKINVVDRGSGYTYANPTISGNTGGTSNTASVKVIIPPVDGHGKDAPKELLSKELGVSLTYTTNESGFITVENDYKKFIMIKDPLFDGVNLQVNNATGTFTTSDTITQISYKTLRGTITGNTTSTTITGTNTELDKALDSGDKVYILDLTANTSTLATIDSVTNSTSATLTANLAFATGAAQAKIAYAEVEAEGLFSGNALPNMTLGNCEPKFTTGSFIIGSTTGYTATINAISVGEKTYNNWNTFDNRFRIAYSSNTGLMPEDAKVYQTSNDADGSNAFFHSANSTYIFLTSVKGTINADANDPINEVDGSATFTLGTTKYNSDMVKGSGEVMYVENITPVSRSGSQSETVKFILSF